MISVVMQSYEAKKPAYFATPSLQLIRALHTSLSQILSYSSSSSSSSSTAPSLEDRFQAHRTASHKVKAVVEKELGLKQVAMGSENQANTMTAFYLPETMTPGDVLPKLAKKGVVFAAGLHREIKDRYIRVGHMGVSVVSESSLSLSLHFVCHYDHDHDDDDNNDAAKDPPISSKPNIIIPNASCHWLTKRVITN